MQKTNLICNNFSGINRTSSIYSSSIITASDMQNVELFSTGVNSGVGIRTSKGNITVCNKLPEGEKVAALIAIGYPDQECAAPKRKTTDELMRVL